MWAERRECGESDLSERGAGAGEAKEEGVRETGQLFGEAEIFFGKGCDVQMRPGRRRGVGISCHGK